MNDKSKFFQKVVFKLSNKRIKLSVNDIVLDLSSILTERQIKIIKLKLENYKNYEIAKKIKVCPATITNEFYKIRKLVKQAKYFRELKYICRRKNK